MNNRDLICDFVKRYPGRDDDEISKTLRIFPRQSVNQACRSLERAGAIKREVGPQGKLVNYPTGKHPIAVQAMQIATSQNSLSAEVATEDWFWEGNVTDRIAQRLEEFGWLIKSQADTRTRQRGLDLHAIRDGVDLMMEAKGYPSSQYRDQRRSTEKKPTNPTTQAQHWFSHALLKALRLKDAHPHSLVAMAFPDFPRYQSLFKETHFSLTKVEVGVLFLSKCGDLSAHGVSID